MACMSMDKRLTDITDRQRRSSSSTGSLEKQTSPTETASLEESDQLA